MKARIATYTFISLRRVFGICKVASTPSSASVPLVGRRGDTLRGSVAGSNPQSNPHVSPLTRKTSCAPAPP